MDLLATISRELSAKPFARCITVWGRTIDRSEARKLERELHHGKRVLRHATRVPSAATEGALPPGRLTASPSGGDPAGVRVCADRSFHGSSE